MHDAGGSEVPEVDVASEIGGDIQIQQSIAIKVDPDRAVAVYPAPEACLRRDIDEARAVEVLEQREIAVPVDEQVLSAIVVEVAPNRAHRNAFARPIQIRDPGARRNFLKRAVATISIQCVGFAELAVGEVEIGTAVAVEVGDRDRCSERGYMGLDAGDLRVEGRSVMHEADAGVHGNIPQGKSWMS